MNEIIRRRKSIRKYEQASLEYAVLAKVQGQITDLVPLHPDVRYTVEIVGKTKGVFNISAPYYLVFRSEDKDGAFENLGFIGQQMDLFFSGNGIGSCWLGMAKPESNENNSLPPVVSMAFGKPAEPLHRDYTDFKRKPLSAISEGEDKRIEAARLAPSAMNLQNWFFAAQDGRIHCYRKKTLFDFMMNRLGCIDIGIAICHIAQESENFSFGKESGAPGRKGFDYMGTVGK